MMPVNFESRMVEKRNELLTDLMAVVERLLLAHEVSANSAKVIASAMADHLANHWGGQNISFPKDFRWKLSHLELEIYDKFNGGNFDSLAMEYDMTERGVRKLIARVRAKLRTRNQHDLFVPLDAPLDGS